MTPFLYHCPTAPENKKWIAQYGKTYSLYVTVQGATAELARAKLELLYAHDNLPPNERKGFDLKGKLAALGVDQDDLL
jgi:hypothetical protein